jgi:hypothetical protein
VFLSAAVLRRFDFDQWLDIINFFFAGFPPGFGLGSPAGRGECKRSAVCLANTSSDFVPLKGK